MTVIVGDDKQNAVGGNEHGRAIDVVMMPDLIGLKSELSDQPGIFNMTVAAEAFGKLSALPGVEGDIENRGGCKTHCAGFVFETPKE